MQSQHYYAANVEHLAESLHERAHALREAAANHDWKRAAGIAHQARLDLDMAESYVHEWQKMVASR